jgi:hypothetical protein
LAENASLLADIEGLLPAAFQPFRHLDRKTTTGRKSPLGGHGWISSPGRQETAMSGHSPIAGERLLILKAVIQRQLLV